MSKNNTIGKVVSQPGGTGMTAAKSNPPIEPETEKEKSWWSVGLDVLQVGLDVAGMIPAVGNIADIANAGVSVARGDYAGAALSLAAAVPGAGQAVTASKLAMKASKGAKAAKGITKASKAQKAARKAQVAKNFKNGGKVKGKTKKSKKKKKFDKCNCGAGIGTTSSVMSPNPVHLGSGEKIHAQTDCVLPGKIPIEWTRTYSSGAECEDWGLLGARWATAYTTSLSLCPQGIVYHDDTGRPVELPALAVGESHDERAEGFILHRIEEERFCLVWRDGSEDYFADAYDHWLPHGYSGINVMKLATPLVATRRLRLVRTQGRDKRGITISHHPEVPENECLLRLVTDDGRVLEALRAPQFSHHHFFDRPEPLPTIGRLEEVRPDGERIVHAQYDYALDERFPENFSKDHPNPAFTRCPTRLNLVSQRDIGGATRRYRYQYHLMTDYTNYNGVEFRITWTSLQALQAHWEMGNTDEATLQQQYPISLDNSYQARALTSGARDGSEGVRLSYKDEDTTCVSYIDGGVFDFVFDQNWLNTAVYLISEKGRRKAQGSQKWDEDGMLISRSDGQGNTTRYDYDAAGNLLRIQDPNGAETRIEYDNYNKPIRVTNALGNSHHYRYDEQGQLVESIDALARKTLFYYDEWGQLIKVTDAKGADKKLSYDAWGNLIGYQDCSGKFTNYKYDEFNRLVEITDALGHATQYKYNCRHQLSSIHHPDQSREKFEFDAEDNLTVYIDAEGHQTRYSYNGQNLPIKRIDPNHHHIHYRYDGERRLTALINANGETYRLVYDQEGQLIQEIGFDGKKTEYKYNPSGQLIVTSSGEQSIQWQRDSMGRLLNKITPEGITRYAYDALGQLTHILSPRSQHYFQYSALGQLLEERTGYYIDNPLTPQQQSLLVSLPNPDASFVLNYAYDELGDRIETILPNGRRLGTLRYGSGHWFSLLWNRQPLVDIKRDDLHRETTRTLGRQPQPLLSGQRSYDPQSRITELSLRKKNGIVRARHYHWSQRGDLQKISDQQQGITCYHYDPLGQLLKATHPGGCKEETFAFDPAGNLLDPNVHPNQSESSGPSQGKSKASLKEQPIPGFRPGAERRLGKVIHNLLKCYLDYEYEYDIQGNTVLKRQPWPDSANDESILNCIYDSENRLIETEKVWGKNKQARQKAYYYYDAFDRRIAKRVVEQRWDKPPVADEAPDHQTESLTRFVWDGDTLVQELRGNDSTTFVYEPESFIPLAQIVSKESFCNQSDTFIPLSDSWLKVKQQRQVNGEDAHVIAWREYMHMQQRQQQADQPANDAANDQVYYYYCDHLGTPLELLDEEGVVVWSADYKAWGKIQRLRVNDVQQPLRFQGQYEDEETGFYYNRYRYYDPECGRFTTQDPIGLLGGVNNYQYAPNPISWIDPLGLTEKNNQRDCNVSKNAYLLRTGGKNTTVNVKTKAEADKLLNEAFPDYQKVNGVGPQDAVGIRKKRKMDRFKQGGAYHKDYAIDPATGRVRGHGPNDAHGQFPHINIKRTDGTKVIINITGG